MGGRRYLYLYGGRGLYAWILGRTLYVKYRCGDNEFTVPLLKLTREVICELDPDACYSSANSVLVSSASAAIEAGIALTLAAKSLIDAATELGFYDRLREAASRRLLEAVQRVGDPLLLSKYGSDPGSVVEVAARHLAALSNIVRKLNRARIV